MEKRPLGHFLPAIKVLLVLFLFFVGLGLIPRVGRWIGKAGTDEQQMHDRKIVPAETENPASFHPATPPGGALAEPTKSADREQAQLKGPAIPPEELDQWLRMPKDEWLPLLKERTATLPEATRQELIAMMDRCQGLAKGGLGTTHPTFKESRDFIVRKSYSRFDEAEK